MDLKFLSFAEKKEIRKQVVFYKEHRRTLQYGTLYRFNPGKANKTDLLCVAKDRRRAVAGHFQTVSTASESNDILPLCGLDTDRK